MNTVLKIYDSRETEPKAFKLCNQYELNTFSFSIDLNNLSYFNDNMYCYLVINHDKETKDFIEFKNNELIDLNKYSLEGGTFKMLVIISKEPIIDGIMPHSNTFISNEIIMRIPKTPMMDCFFK